LAIGRRVIPREPIQDLSRESDDVHDAPAAWVGPARVAARSLAMLALAAFAILVLLPVAVAAQATVPT
jgi:hypothetical protein